MFNTFKQPQHKTVNCWPQRVNCQLLNEYCLLFFFFIKGFLNPRILEYEIIETRIVYLRLVEFVLHSRRASSFLLEFFSSSWMFSPPRGCLLLLLDVFSSSWMSSPPLGCLLLFLHVFSSSWMSFPPPGYLLLLLEVDLVSSRRQVARPGATGRCSAS